MEPAEISPFELQERVLLFVATKKDAEVSQRLLGNVGLVATHCRTPGDLIREVHAGAAVVLATDELLAGNHVDELLRALEQQPEWSDLPFVLLMRGGVQSARATEVLQRITNVTILERPTGMRSLLSVVQAAVRDRRRQYKTRAHIETVRAAEAKARQADRAKDDFLAALSHELRTPLTPVLLAATEAATSPQLSDDLRETFEVIAKNISLEARLIDDLLDLTRITRGKLALTKAAHDVIGVLRDAIANVEPDFAQKRLRLSTAMEVESAVVECDPTRLQQVFWNVLRNAAKFTPPEGRVLVSVTAPAGAGTVVIRITDTGIGMSEGELGRAFDAFVQGDHATSGVHRFGGLGLGLAISRTLLELHDGKITAESDGPAKGSSFRIELPLCAEIPRREPVEPGEAAPGESASGRSLQILLVEDHEPTRLALRRFLTTRNHRVVVAGTLAEGRAAAAANTFDLLMSDIGLPDGNGHALVREFQEHGGTLAVALTGYGMEDDVQRSREAGFFAHLTKPLRMGDLEGLLKAVAAKLAEPQSQPATAGRNSAGD